MLRYMILFILLVATYTPSFAQSVQHGDISLPPVENSASTQQVPLSQDLVIDKKNYTNSAILQGLNKITARTSTLELNHGEVITFGNLEIILYACWKAPPEEQPESKGLLGIWEQVPGEDKNIVFSGWMFASTPSVSSLEHPIYDITLLECRL